MRLWLGLWLAIAAPAALAFPTDQHYRLTTEPAELGMNWTERWDSEAASDFLVYQRPISWDVQYWQKPRVFDLSVGSISSKQFLQQRRLKLYHALSETVEFRFHWFEERDFEQDRTALPMELKFRLGPHWAVSGFGQTSLYKDENDVGGSLFFYPSPIWELRTTAAFGDFQRNKRNLETDRWSTPPRAYTVSVMHTPEGGSDNLHRLEAHWENASTRENLGAPVTTLQYQSLSALGSHTLPWLRPMRWRLLYDRGIYQDHTTQITRERKRSLNQVEFEFRMGPHIVRPSLNYFYREARQNGDQTLYRELLPAFWMEFLPGYSSWGTRLFSLGYDATMFDKRHGEDTQEATENRLNTKYEMFFTTGARLALLFTFDLDEFGSESTWEGGAAQFRMDF